jgi:serine phosphatase RsbU (regulator of sigma subunit)/anti-sigma regulatory factor (Ser/Thr protein kinase)
VSAMRDRVPDAAPAGAASMASPAPRARRMWRIRWIVAGAMMLLTAVAVVSVGAVGERNTRRALVADFESRLILQARNLAMVGSGALLTDVPEWTLLPLIKEIQGRQPELAIIDVVDRAGIIRADSDVRRIGTAFAPPPGLRPEPGGAALLSGESLLADRQLLVVSTPIVDARAHQLGTAWVGLRRAAIERRLEAARRQQALVLALFLALGAAAALGLSSVLLRPIGALQAGLERIGRGDLDTPLAMRDRTEIGALAGSINRMAQQLKTAQGELIQRERIAAEMQLAQRIQRSLLPDGRRVAGPFVIEGELEPATEVGGDYFQIFELPGGRIGVAVADVSGKGLGGSLVTAMLHALLRATVAAHDSPATLLAALDRQLGEMLEVGTFVTMFYGILDPRSGQLTFASAGHNPLLILRADTELAEWKRAPGAPLAALRGRIRARYGEVSVVSGPGDVWVQYTDGISEAFSHVDDEVFGLDRLAAAARHSRGRGARAVLDALVESVADWRGGKPPHDDDTLLVISRELEGAPLAMPEPVVAAAAHGLVPDTLAQVPSPEAACMARLTRAQAFGSHIALVASRRSVEQIDGWLEGLPELATLGRRSKSLLKLALQEVSANVIEHACGLDATQLFDIWWVPEGTAAGHFLVRDRGRSFRYQDWQPSRLSDPDVRRRGRGFGLDIVHRVMSRLEYHPATLEGNLTLLTFDPRKPSLREEIHEHRS